MSDRRGSYRRSSGKITKALGLADRATPVQHVKHVQQVKMEDLETERQFMGWVIEFAQLHHWKVFHDEDSRRNAPGLPDLILVRGQRLIFAELKTEAGRIRPEQRDWLASLLSVSAASYGAVAVFVWRPSDRKVIEEVLG